MSRKQRPLAAFDETSSYPLPIIRAFAGSRQDLVPRIALELGPDAHECEQRAILIQRSKLKPMPVTRYTAALSSTSTSPIVMVVCCSPLL